MYSNHYKFLNDIHYDWLTTSFKSVQPVTVRLEDVHFGAVFSEIITKPTIKKVIFNDPATIIYWTDGSKTVVKCQNGEEFDPEKGFVMAYLKKLLGNKNEFNKEIHKWVKDV